MMAGWVTFTTSKKHSTALGLKDGKWELWDLVYTQVFCFDAPNSCNYNTMAIKSLP